MARVWTSLNAEKVAVQPYYVIPDQLNRLKDGALPAKLVEKAETLQNTCRQIFAYGEGESIHMLLRAGHPKSNPPRSRRLPLEALLR
jgi:hypothetical protein